MAWYQFVNVMSADNDLSLMDASKGASYDWTRHRFFAEAPVILSRAKEIDAIHQAYGPEAASWIPAVCERQLFQLFDGVSPPWPAYETWSDNMVTRGDCLTVFGPLLLPPRPADFLDEATIVSLRRAGQLAGLSKLGRSKREVITRIRPLLAAEALADLRGEGQHRWARFQLEPAIMTRFRVLHSAISAILCSARYLALLATLECSKVVWSYAPGPPACDGCLALDGSGACPILELEGCLPHVPPLHPGCRCVPMAK